MHITHQNKMTVKFQNNNNMMLFTTHCQRMNDNRHRLAEAVITMVYAVIVFHAML